VTGLCGYACGRARAALTRRQDAAPRRLGVGTDGSSPILECVLVRGGAVGLCEWPLVGAGGHCFVSFRLKRSNYAVTATPLARLQSPRAPLLPSDQKPTHMSARGSPCLGDHQRPGSARGRHPSGVPRDVLGARKLSARRRVQASYLGRCGWRWVAAECEQRRAAMSERSR
jgi:hypothetical protein